MPDQTDDAHDVNDAVEGVPTCYRHRDRETYVRCNRCDKYICPDCMHTASVGFHCPDCVREGNKTVRQHQTIFGGKVAADGLVTKVLIGICVLTYILQVSDPTIVAKYADLPARAFGPFTQGVAAGEFYRLITSAFLHGSVIHIAFNMYALFIFGTQVEAALGRARYVGVYLVAALGGSTLSFVLAHVGPSSGFPVDSTSSVGASGAVFGLFGAYYVVARRLRADTGQIVGLIVINLAFGFVVPAIDVWAHIGGLITGFALTFAMARVPRGPRRGLIQGAAAVAITVALIAVVAVHTHDLRQRFPELRGGSTVPISQDGALPPAR
jgi:membrane associated rhomboid family serine protease